MAPYRLAYCVVLALSIAAATVSANAQQHAHTHGLIALDAAVDAQSITLQLEAPLDSLVGFERSPRTDEEKARVAEMVTRLNAADQLFLPDPAAQCKLSGVDLDSDALHLGSAKLESAHRDDYASESEGTTIHDSHGHADIDMTIVFTCAKAADARYVDIKLFELFIGIRRIDAQVAAPQGQFKRTLNAEAPRLSWGR